MQDDKKEKPKDEKKKKNKYIVKDGDGNIMDVEVPESWIKAATRCGSPVRNKPRCRRPMQ